MPSNHMIHPECARAISRLIQLKDPKREDFLELRTHGRDAYSEMGWDELQSYINEKTIVIVEQFEDEQNIMSALRWVARGLPVWLAIRKVRTDYAMYRYMRS
ncbi:hypothetical protein [Brevibacillus brevis]|uniref:DUF4258 domain-containing protein n=1 Tax=Brevibacillus brevis TaxID=1393 RepID=A0ABY9T7H5_BREBE|nr:hypothetical protein [Brevibacillus brevis]WNC16058.1 hypothetical protein RGB73_07000 [Brevibacillus brevis]